MDHLDSYFGLPPLADPGVIREFFLSARKNFHYLSVISCPNFWFLFFICHVPCAGLGPGFGVEGSDEGSGRCARKMLCLYDI